jgi:two-component system, response regulator YesN
MSKILLVDDMPVIRSVIGQILKQQNLGFSAIWEAANGIEAVEMARTYKPDIILMDIKMPGLTGLQATERIRQQNPTIKIVMLTAYDEFTYVQKALKLGARDYLLKPVRPDKLVELLVEIQQEIKQERRDMRTVELVKDSLQKTLPVLETNLVENLIRGTLPDDASIEESLSYLGKRLIWPVVMVTKIDNFDQIMRNRAGAEVQQIYAMLVHLVRQELPDPNRALVGYSSPGRVVAIVSTDQHLATTMQMRELGNRIFQTIVSQTPFTVTIGFGKRYRNIESIPFSYAEANLARRYYRHLAKQTVIGIEEVEDVLPPGSDSIMYRVQRERELVKAVTTNQQKIAQNLVNEIIDYLAQRYQGTPEAMKNHCTELVTLIAWGAINTGVSEAQILEALHQQVRALSSWKTGAEIRAWTLNSMTEIMTLVQARLQRRDAVQDAITYIHGHYQRSDISLQEVADAVNLSQSYLSSQFKARTGVNYMRYLTRVRLEEAQKLLRTTDLSIAQVAEAVGYPNVTNFYRHFQRQTNMTPAMYRQPKNV